MKTFSDAALDALTRGDAIVSASVEILPTTQVSYSALGAVNVAATDFTGTFDDRTTLFSGFATDDVFRVSKPSVASNPSLSWDGWSAWSADNSTTPTSPPVVGKTWSNNFSVYGNTGGSDTLVFQPSLDSNLYTTEADAFAALAAQVPATFSGYNNYKVVVISDPNPPDNRHGLSLLIDRGIPVAGSGTAIRLWGGYGDADLPSDVGTSTFKGIGDRGLIQSSSGAIGGSAQNLTLALSSIEAAALEVLEPDEVRGASVVVRRLIFDSAGKTLLGAYVYSRGRLDELKTVEQVGGAASIQISVEGAARGLGRRGGRLRSDADQRLVSSTDGFFKNVSFAAQKVLYWGGKMPSGGGRATRGA